jgi:hypothetical protein
MMKRIIIGALLIASVAACGGAVASGSQEAPTKVTIDESHAVRDQGIHDAAGPDTTVAPTTTEAPATTTTEARRVESASSQDQAFYMTLALSGHFPDFDSSYVPGTNPEIDRHFYAMRDSMKEMLAAADEALALDGSCETYGLVTMVMLDSFAPSTPEQVGTLVGAVDAAYDLDSEFVDAGQRC